MAASKWHSIWVIALRWPEEGASSWAQRVENRLMSTYGHVQDGRATRDTGDSIPSMLLSSDLSPFRDSRAVHLLFARQEVTSE